MRALSTRLSILPLAPLALACAVDRSEAIETEIRRLSAQADEGVLKIDRALKDPELTSSELGEGVRKVEVAARMLHTLESDERANDLLQLMAIVHQARAWDDVARTLESADAPNLEAGQRALVSSVLGEKALPARAQAIDGYLRARDRACRSRLDRLPVMLEILDGIARYGESNISLDRPCAGL